MSSVSVRNMLNLIALAGAPSVAGVKIGMRASGPEGSDHVLSAEGPTGNTNILEDALSLNPTNEVLQRMKQSLDSQFFAAEQFSAFNEEGDLDLTPEDEYTSQSVSLFEDRSWYHRFPVETVVDEETGEPIMVSSFKPGSVYKIGKDFCQGQCANRSGLGQEEGECLPKFLDRTLVWIDDVTSNLYLLRTMGRHPKSARMLWTDQLAPGRTRMVNFVQDYTKEGPFVVGGENLTLQDVCVDLSIAESEEEADKDENLTPTGNVFQKTALQKKSEYPWFKVDHVVHWLSWGDRDRTDEEIKQIVLEKWEDVDYDGNMSLRNETGFEKSEVKFCKDDLKDNLEENIEEGNPICNAFFFDSFFKSMPHHAHVHVFFLKKGSEKLPIDGGRFKGFEEAEAKGQNKFCTWEDMVNGGKTAPHGELTVVDAQMTCNHGPFSLANNSSRTGNMGLQYYPSRGNPLFSMPQILPLECRNELQAMSKKGGMYKPSLVITNPADNESSSFETSFSRWVRQGVQSGQDPARQLLGEYVEDLRNRLPAVELAKYHHADYATRRHIDPVFLVADVSASLKNPKDFRRVRETVRLNEDGTRYVISRTIVSSDEEANSVLPSTTVEQGRVSFSETTIGQVPS